tara:strand:+ start:2963 stop:3133 length:171 start_codon:yes stop_codon:yes gene_type:complete
MINKFVEQVLEVSIMLPDYQKKQIISVLIASMLTPKSDDDARDAYNRLIDNLEDEI